MRKQGIKPNVVTYSIFIDTLCKIEMVSKAEYIVGTMIKQGIVPNIVTYKMRNSVLQLDIISHTIIIDGLCKAGHTEVANELFCQLSGLPDEASQLFKRMGDNDCLSDNICYNVMIQGFLQSNYSSKATQFLTEIV
ncbi:hypothetical protein Goklo_019047, partial [Gossypium klotzschianum]|nr:hypothetical protein [Gossypium klotzschianum]